MGNYACLMADDVEVRLSCRLFVVAHGANIKMVVYMKVCRTLGTARVGLC